MSGDKYSRDKARWRKKYQDRVRQKKRNFFRGMTPIWKAALMKDVGDGTCQRR